MCIAFKGDLKEMFIFSFLVAHSTKGQELFDHPLYIPYWILLTPSIQHCVNILTGLGPHILDVFTMFPVKRK